MKIARITRHCSGGGGGGGGTAGTGYGYLYYLLTHRLLALRDARTLQIATRHIVVWVTAVCNSFVLKTTSS